MQVPLIRLQCGANSYDWGKKGNASAAARFAAATPSDDFTIQDDTPYAEASFHLLTSSRVAQLILKLACSSGWAHTLPTPPKT